MAQYGNKGSKNPPWARADQSGMGMATNQMQQSLLNPNLAAALPNAAMLPYPQPQMFQGQIGYQQQFETNSLERIAGFIMITPSHPSSIKEQSIKNHLLSPSSSEAVAPKGQIYNNIGTVQYPTRALNSAAFQNAATPSVQNNQQRSNESNKERVITGNVTKLQDNFGFVDDDIFFQLSCVTNGANNLRIGSRVLVEATFNPTMPFKWNAQRIQVLPTNTNQNQQQRGNYSAVPPPCKTENNSGDRFSNNRYGNNRNQQQQNKNKQQQQQQVQARRPQVDRVRERSASVDSDRKRRKNERRGSTSRDRRTRSRSRSPTRKKRRAYVPRYNVTIPKFNLNNVTGSLRDCPRPSTSTNEPSKWTHNKQPRRAENHSQQIKEMKIEVKKVEENFRNASQEQKRPGQSGCRKLEEKSQISRHISKEISSCSESLRSEETPKEPSNIPCNENKNCSKSTEKEIIVKIITKDCKRPMTNEDLVYVIEQAENTMISKKGLLVLGTHLLREAVWVICKNPQTVDWLKGVVSDIPAPCVGHPGYLALGPRDIPPNERFFVWIPGKRDPTRVMRLLDVHEGIDINAFHIQKVIPNEGGNTYIFGVEPLGVQWLKSVDFKPCCGMLGTVHFLHWSQEAVLSIPTSDKAPTEAEAALKTKEEATGRGILKELTLVIKPERRD